MEKIRSVKLALVLGASALCGVSTSFAAGKLYNQTSTTGLSISTATQPTVLDDINFAATATTVRQELSGMTFGYGDLAGTTAQSGVVFVDFYDTYNPASTGSVVSDYLGGFGGTFTIPANSTAATTFNASSFSGLTGLTTPIFFNDPNFAIVITLTDSTGSFYSTVTSPLLSVPGTPTVGTSTTGVYRDTNSDGTFQATEFNATMGNLYLSLTTVNNAAVPEPSTWALSTLGLAGCAGMVLRRRKRA